MSELIVRLINLLREERFLEYKQSMPWDALKEKIAKTAMAMANIPDGGTIIIGMTKNGNLYEADGVVPEHLASYKVDDIQAYINRFADPFVKVQSTFVTVESKEFIAIVVAEFDEIPVICGRNSTDLREGTVYTRSNRIPESVPISSQTEMRELLELATDKGVRKFMRRAHRTGIQGGAPQISDDDLFIAQLGGL